MTGAPERLGPRRTVHKRHLLWSADGTWERLVRYVLSAADAGDGIDWNINVDSTITRAHQHAAGAPQTPPPAGTWQVLNYTAEQGKPPLIMPE